MSNIVRKSFLLILCIGLLMNFQAWSQVNFCPGNTGEAIFEEDFGQGVPNGPPLGVGVTSYTYVDQGPDDGQYTISSDLMQLPGFQDITDNTGNINGKALIVNASFDAGLFFQIPIDGLCENNPYEFSAFLVNLYNVSTDFCPDTGIPVNVKFQIWDETDTTILAEASTGNIPGSSTPPSWEQYAVTFETLPNQTSVILKMLNNGDGGCGNDLAIDDIAFRSCGDLTEIFDDNDDMEINLCEDESINNLTLTAEPDFSVYNSHFYQWQQSDDGMVWSNITGETDEILRLNTIDTTQFYRVLVAEDLVNVNNNSCNSISNVFEVNVQAFIPAVSLGDREICRGEVGVLEVENNPAIQIDWYDAPTGGNLLLEDSFSFEPESQGVYYAESTTLAVDCTAEVRTPVELSIKENTEDEYQNITICDGDEVELDAEVIGFELAYLWSTGETRPQITIEEEGLYTVERENINGCISTKTFEVSFFERAIVQDINTINNNIVVELQNTGDFSFSIDGENFQTSPVFDNIPGGLYDIRILSGGDCAAEVISFPHLVIPKFFTPNGDGINDYFRIPADRFFDSFQIAVFDRYGKVVAFAERAPFVWDGTYNGKPLPSQDYWYKLKINGETFTGHITMKR